MGKEQISHISEPSNLQETSVLSSSGTRAQLTSKNDKKIRKQRSKHIRITKTTASSETSLNPQSALKQPSHNTQFTSYSTPASPLNLSLQVQDQTNCQLAQACQHLDTIGEHLFERQARFPLPQLQYSPRFGSTQRLRLIQLIVLTCRRLNLRLQTQFLAIDIFHRICTAAPFQRYHSALKAASSLYVAAKYEQVSAPQAHFFSTLDPYQRILPQNIIKLQGSILLYLNFNLSYALPLNFVQLLCLKFQLNPESRYALVQLCRRSVCKEELWTGRGSLLAMACFSTLFGRVKEWQQVQQLRIELEWRITILQQLWGQ